MFHRFIQRVGSLAVCALVFLAGCTTAGKASKQGFQADRQGESAPLSELSPGDTIDVSVEVDGNMEVLSHSAQINPQGVVTLPLVGDVEIGGCTLNAARAVITQTYGSYYVNPPVIMLSLAAASGTGEWGSITVMGRVARPGRVPLHSQQGMNLTEAIQLAGGFSGSAKSSDIRVSRIGKDGKKRRVSIDYEEIGKGGDASADIKLIAGDIVYVPERIF